MSQKKFSYKKGDCTVEGDFTRLNKLVEELGKKYYVDIGILGEETYSDGKINLAGIGSVQEFGSRDKRTPERSFIRMPLQTGQEDIEKQVGVNFQKNLEDGNIKQIFKEIGIAGENRIQDAFDTGGFGTWQENAQITIHGGWMSRYGKSFFVKGKESETPLVDTGALAQSITSKVGSNKK
jgi:hypothetical protein